MNIEQIKDKYQNRIFTILCGIAGIIKTSKRKWKVVLPETEPETDECYHWNMDVFRHGKPNVMISFTIAESEIYDGEKNGVNFIIGIEEADGHCLGELIPLNYSSECWVSRNDEKAIEERFQLLENSDFNGIVKVLSE